MDHSFVVCLCALVVLLQRTRFLTKVRIKFRIKWFLRRKWKFSPSACDGPPATDSDRSADPCRLRRSSACSCGDILQSQLHDTVSDPWRRSCAALSHSSRVELGQAAALPWVAALPLMNKRSKTIGGPLRLAGTMTFTIGCDGSA